MKVAVIGAGYWGPNLIRNFLSQDEVENVIACDRDENRLAKMRRTFHGIEISTDYEEVIGRADIEIVAIATPVSLHYEIAKKSLSAGKHCWIEKPMTVNSAEAEELIELADKKNLKIFVDHTFIYTGAVRKMKEIITSGRLGELYYFDSVRVNLGLFQHDVNVIWDLAPHDLSMVDHVIGEPARSISAWGCSHANPDIEDIAYVNVDYGERMLATFHVNWLSPVKVRQIIFAGSRKSIIFNELNTTEPVKVYGRGIDVTESDAVTGP